MARTYTAGAFQNFRFSRLRLLILSIDFGRRLAWRRYHQTHGQGLPSRSTVAALLLVTYIGGDVFVQ
jgi:hypothetical protein